MSDFSLAREKDPEGIAIPKDAATVIVFREATTGGVELFCVERSAKSPFMPGALVFPGGKLAPSDASEGFDLHVSPPRAPRRTAAPFADGERHLRALAIAAARETLEEAALLLALPHQGDEGVAALRERLAAAPDDFERVLREAGLRLTLDSLVPFARWITPVAESRRFDTRFYLASAPPGQSGDVDRRETVSSFWATPADVLGRFDAGQLTLFTPTHRTLELLATCSSVDDVLALAARQSLEPICPRLVPQGTTLALTLPGDPEHPDHDVRVEGSSRYVLREGRWLPENAPR